MFGVQGKRRMSLYRLPHNGLPEKQQDIDDVIEMIQAVGGVPVEPDAEAMAKRIIEWSYEPEGETSVGELIAELWHVGIRGDHE
jgi:hypothetical protein